MELENYIYFIKPEMTEGNTKFKYYSFFHTTYVNPLTYDYKHI